MLRTPFNHPIETGIRSLITLSAVFPERCDLQRLIYFDYLLVHSGDLPDGPPSLHPATPHRSGEFITRRETVRQGLHLLSDRDLVSVHYGIDGITYKAEPLGMALTQALQGVYSRRLQVIAAWLAARFHDVSNDDLHTLMQGHVTQWGSEFFREALVRNNIDG